MQVSEAMTHGCEALRKNDSLRAAAMRMRDNDIGMLVVNDEQGWIAGLITDRDIVVRAVAEGRSCEDKVSEFMSRDVVTCYADADLEDAVRMMEDRQVRRLLVCDRNGNPKGVLAQADIARALGRKPITGEMLRGISQPERPQAHH